MSKAYHHGDLRAALLETARALVAERGVDGWSVREASGRVGVSASAAYHHFASRDVLLDALSARVLAELSTALREAADTAGDDDALARLCAYGRRYVRWAGEEPAVARLAFRPVTSGREQPGGWHPHQVLDDELDRLVTAGVLPGHARPGADFVVWSAVHGLAVLVADGLVRGDDPADLDRFSDRLVRTTVNGLCHEPPATAPAVRSRHTASRADRG